MSDLTPPLLRPGPWTCTCSAFSFLSLRLPPPSFLLRFIYPLPTQPYVLFTRAFPRRLCDRVDAVTAVAAFAFFFFFSLFSSLTSWRGVVRSLRTPPSLPPPHALFWFFSPSPGRYDRDVGVCHVSWRWLIVVFGRTVRQWTVNGGSGVWRALGQPVGAVVRLFVRHNALESCSSSSSSSPPRLHCLFYFYWWDGPCG